MAWGKQEPQAESLVSKLIPLVILFAFLGAAAFIGYQIYLSVGKMQDAASQKMGKKNVVFTKDGVKVGVKHVETEKYVDKTQSVFVKAWNLSGNAKEDKKQKSK